MIKRSKSPLLFFLIVASMSSVLKAQIPLLPHIYAADPSAHIWEEDPETLWIYASTDVPGTNTHKTMNGYHVYSTKDLVNWTDYGRVLAVEDVEWASTMAWAADAVFWKGKYYLVYCMKERATGTTRTGLAVSPNPQGPFEDIGYVQGVEFGQDPALFIDDGKPYLFWGAGQFAHAAQLTEDLKSIIEDTFVDLTPQLFEVFEGPWVHKYEGTYYLSYPALPDGTWPEHLYYATAKYPLGPYTFQKEYIGYFENHGSTNHGSIIPWKDQWIAFHHSAHLSGGNSTERSLLADWLTYDEKGAIQPIPEPKGLGLAEEAKVTIFLEAENAPMQGGALDGTLVRREKAGFSGSGYVTGFETDFNYVEVMVQVAKDMTADLQIRLDVPEEVEADIFVGPVVLDKTWTGQKLKQTEGWEILNLGEVQLKAGDNMIKVWAYQDAGLKIDWFKVTPNFN